LLHPAQDRKLNACFLPLFAPLHLQLAIYSKVDRLSPHRFKADESYQVGSPDMTPVQCYLDYKGIVALAKEQGVGEAQTCAASRAAGSMPAGPGRSRRRRRPSGAAAARRTRAVQANAHATST
jgi:hypothetical protein